MPWLPSEGAIADSTLRGVGSVARAGAHQSGRNLYSGPGHRSGVSASQPPKTYISDLRPSRTATVEAVVARLEEVREVPTRGGGTKKVRNGKLQDGTGEIGLVLWGSEVDLVEAGDRIRIVEGWVKDYQGRPQISLGRTGKIEKLGGAPEGRSPRAR